MDFLWHVGATDDKAKHIHVIRATCGEHFQYASPLDFVYFAIACVEREKFPLIGPAVTRRALRTLTTVYNDDKKDGIKTVVCFVCGQKEVTIKGPDVLRYQRGVAVRDESPLCNRNK